MSSHKEAQQRLLELIRDLGGSWSPEPGSAKAEILRMAERMVEDGLLTATIALNTGRKTFRVVEKQP